MYFRRVKGLLWMLPTRGVHEIIRDDDKTLSLRSGASDRRTGSALAVSTLLASVSLALAIVSDGHWKTLNPLFIGTLFLSVANAIGHVRLWSNRRNYYRFISIDATGIRLQRAQGARPEELPTERLHSVLLVSDGRSEVRVYVNGSRECRFAIVLPSLDHLDQVVSNTSRILGLKCGSPLAGQQRKLIELTQDVTDKQIHERPLVQRQLTFFRVKKTDDRLTVSLTDTGGGADSRYGRFIYTYDGYFHQMNTGLRMTLPIPADSVREVVATVSEQLAHNRDPKNRVMGELYLIREDHRIDTLLRANYATELEPAAFALSLRDQLHALRNQMNKFCREQGD